MPETPISPVPRSHAEARENYDRLSRWYDLISGASEQRYKDTGLKMLAVKRGERVLEVGVGTGKCLPPLASAVGAEGLVWGVDLSGGMLKVAARRVADTPLPQQVRLVQANALALPCANGSLDALFSSFTLELFDTPEIPRMLAECRRVLRPEGRVCLVSLLKEGRGSSIVQLYEWFHRTFPQAIDCRPIPLQGLVAAAGFEILQVREMMMWGLPVGLVLAKPA